LFNRGKTQFATLCAACHQPEGQGLAGLAPALVNSRWALADERIAARIVLAGKARENLVMPGLRAVLDDEAIAAVLTFVRNSWGNAGGAVSPVVVAEARAATAKREEPFSEPELGALENTLAPARKKKNKK
jgi:mono/diheme cytochrome c family protein